MFLGRLMDRCMIFACQMRGQRLSHIWLQVHSLTSIDQGEAQCPQTISCAIAKQAALDLVWVIETLMVMHMHTCCCMSCRQPASQQDEPWYCSCIYATQQLLLLSRRIYGAIQPAVSYPTLTPNILYHATAAELNPIMLNSGLILYTNHLAA